MMSSLITDSSRTKPQPKWKQAAITAARQLPVARWMKP